MVAMSLTPTPKNPLADYPKVRDHLYLAQWIANGVLGAIGVVLVLLGDSPLWFVVVSALGNYVWSYLGLTAKRNVTEPEPVEFFDEDDEDWNW